MVLGLIKHSPWVSQTSSASLLPDLQREAVGSQVPTNLLQTRASGKMKKPGHWGPVRRAGNSKSAQLCLLWNQLCVFIPIQRRLQTPEPKERGHLEILGFELLSGGASWCIRAEEMGIQQEGRGCSTVPTQIPARCQPRGCARRDKRRSSG